VQDVLAIFNIEGCLSLICIYYSFFSTSLAKFEYHFKSAGPNDQHSSGAVTENDITIMGYIMSVISHVDAFVINLDFGLEKKCYDRPIYLG
jgi:hypothetical protein